MKQFVFEDLLSYLTEVEGQQLSDGITEVSFHSGTKHCGSGPASSSEEPGSPSLTGPILRFSGVPIL
jgi:hypothetical protein